MKHQLLALTLAAGVLLTLPGCAPATAEGVTEHPVPRAATATADPRAQTGMTSFGVALLRQARTAGDSALISPLSAALCLGMAANGAGGDTRAAFEAVLGADVDALNATAAALTADYAELGGSTNCAVANSLWADGDTTVEGGFLEAVSGYTPGVFTADLDTPAARAAINQWVSEHTERMIPQILAEDLGPDTALVLANALYVENAFETPFPGKDTWARTFRSAAGAEARMDFMHRDGEMTYCSDGAASGVLLPYDDGRLAFAAVLPEGDLDAYLEGLDGAALASLLSSGETVEVDLSLPKFTAEYGAGLSSALKAMGLETAFDPSGADFSAMGSRDGPLYLSEVLQKAKIEVNEKGTRASAATAAVMKAVGSSAPESGVTLVLDRPFLYAIWDTQANIPLFLGCFEGK